MENRQFNIEKSKIQMAICLGLPLTITTYTLPHEMEIYMGNVLAEFLEEIGQSHMFQYLQYCLNELVTNAKKANTKRVYFKEKGLDINSEADYEAGMATFKEDTLSNIDHYLQLQKNEGLYIKMFLQVKNNKVKLEIRNNSELTVFEYKRIHDKLMRAQCYASVQEAMEQILDASEGAGLGIIIMILMLQKIGLEDDNFQTLCENGETINRIVLPFSENTQKNIDLISNEFIKTIDELPQFPQNIVQLNRLLNNPDSKMSTIAQQISSDVALTGELLKLVNSAAFALKNPCSSIIDALKMVGIRGVKNLLITIGSIETFASVRGNKEEMWSHAYQVAFFSYNLARNFCGSSREIVDDSYLCGLLHDMGKIIFETAHPDLIKQVIKKAEGKGAAAKAFEQLVAGVNHAEIGARIAEKWNFPPAIAAVIRYHHTPEDASEDIQKLSAIVCLADLVAHYGAGDVDFYQIDTFLLEMFSIQSEEQFKGIADKLQQAFEQQNG